MCCCTQIVERLVRLLEKALDLNWPTLFARALELGLVLGVEVCCCTQIGERLARLLEEALFLD